MVNLLSQRTIHFYSRYQVGTYTLYNIQLVVMSIDSCFSSSLLFIPLSIQYVCVCKVDNFNGGTKEADDLSSRLRKVVIWTGNVLIFLTLRVKQKGSYRIGSNTQARGEAFSIILVKYRDTLEIFVGLGETNFQSSSP